VPAGITMLPQVGSPLPPIHTPTHPPTRPHGASRGPDPHLVQGQLLLLAHVACPFVSLLLAAPPTSAAYYQSGSLQQHGARH
jgi:hypothetical protein